MRMLPWLAASFLVLPTLASSQEKSDKAKDDPRTARAKALIESMSKKKFDDARKHFDEKLTKMMEKDNLPDLWKKITEQLGELKKVGPTRTDNLGGLNVVYVPCEFAKTKLDM